MHEYSVKLANPQPKQININIYQKQQKKQNQNSKNAHKIIKKPSLWTKSHKKIKFWGPFEYLCVDQNMLL